ncbi:MAG: GNAT family N-acetyltransferase [Thiomargarita sp.]|nr:GNAT family N-acetyltransferase [Thiomargarita sp.]
MDYTALDFPLNVYAHCLYLEEANVNYLHYALFNEDEALAQVQGAQQRSTDLLLARLPKPPCHILEIGIGLGTTAATLIKRGYTVTGITPDAQQIALARQRAHAHFECVTLEMFSTTERYDVILFQESAQYIHSLTLFNKAHSLLKDDGVILITDEFSFRHTAKYATYSLPSLTDTLAQASRCGFELTEKIDLSVQAAPTLEYLLWVIDLHKAELLVALALKAEVINELLRVLREYQQKYQDGHYGYALLNFRKKVAPRWLLSTVTSQDKEALKNLFSDVFPPPKMTEAHWEWKYKEGLGIAAWRDGKMIAHYGSVLRDIRYFGHAQMAAQITDVMVLEEERGLLTRKGAFFLTTATFLENYMGYGAQTYLGYGFPTQRAMKIAERLNLYAPVGKMVELHWEASTAKPHLWTRIRHLSPQDLNKNKDIINTLWHDMASCFTDSIIGVRDWKYVQHRYLSHPYKQYELLLITQRFTGQPLAIIVIARQDDTCHIRDFIGNIAHLPEVIKHIRRLAKNWALKHVNLWITENFVTVFPKAEQRDLEIQIPHNIWSPGVPVAEVDGHWWLMGGDTDFL